MINSPASGSSVAVGQEILIDSTATANACVARVELAVAGVVVRRDMPPSGNPTTFRVSQPWTPATEGQTTISVVAYDVNGNSSDAASITLQAVSSGGVVPTSPGATAVPGATEVPPVTGPTETPPPPVTTEAGCTLDSQYVTDVTIPDGTIMTLGAGFVKTWRVRNSGTCDWDAGFQLVFVSGNQMNGPASVLLPAVAAGAQTDISVSLTAPNSYGTHKGTWRMRSIDGDVFGTNLTVVIAIPAPATDTPVPTETPLPTDVPTNAPTDVPTLPPPAIAPYTQYVTSQVNVGAGSTGAAIATCPSDSVVVGGGYAAKHTVTFYAQYKSGNGWRGDAKNNDGSSQQITVFAVCLYGVPGASVTQVHAQATVTPGDREKALATCPAGSVATGGGFHAYPDGSLRVYNSSKADSGEGWQSWVYNNSGSNKTHHAYAMCLSGTGGTTARILKSVDIASGSTGYAVPTCGGGSLVTGGGFAAQDDLLIYSSSGPYSDDEWRVYVKNTHASEERLLFGYAVCLSLP
ncbi:MAG: hypothetical protein JW918_08145 [Anaerolineae bacterium]|nr:hypothetical protein [Anaerolineae bacterium]